MANRDWILIFVLGIGWGSAFFFNEILLREVGPVTVGLSRVGMALIGCLTFLAATGRSLRIRRSALLQTAIFGLLMLALPLSIFPIGQQYVQSGVAGIVNALTPIMVMAIAHFWPEGERATPLKALGALAGFCGIVLLALPGLEPGQGGYLFGTLFMVLGPVCYGIATNYVRVLRDIDPVVRMAWAFFWSTLALLPLALLREGVPHVTQTSTWLSMAFLGLVLTGGFFIIFFFLLARAGATKSSTVTFIAPVSAVLLGALILGEEITLLHLAGMSAIFLGLLLIDGRLFSRQSNIQPNR